MDDQPQKQSSENEFRIPIQDVHDVFAPEERLACDNGQNVFNLKTPNPIINYDSLYKNNRRISGYSPSVFTPGEDYIPVYSSDNMNMFSQWMRDRGSLYSQGTGSIYHSCLTQNISTNDIIISPSLNMNRSVPTQTETAESRLSSSNVTSNMTDNNASKQSTPDLFCRLLSAKLDDECKISLPTLDMISKTLFDKLARELVKVKRDNVDLRNQNLKLHYRQEKIQQELKMCLQQAGICEMNVELPPDSNMASGGHSTAEVHARSTEYQGSLSDHKMEKEDEELKKRMSEDEAFLKKYKETCDKLLEETKRCKNLERSLEDERNRFRRDVKRFKEKIESLKSKLNAQESGSSAEYKRVCYSSSKKKSPNMMNQFNLDKSEYIKQGAIPKE